MSIEIMSACWPLQGMNSTQKAVLICLADHANHLGVCWPSVARIAMRTSLSTRAVQKALGWLEEHKVLSRNARNQQSNLYKLTPQTYSTNEGTEGAKPAAAADSPALGSTFTQLVQDMRPAPAADAPGTVIETSNEPPKKARHTQKRQSRLLSASNAAQIAPGISAAVISDFLSYREELGRPLTATAWKIIVDDLNLSSIAISPEQALGEAMSLGWRSVKSEWLTGRMKNTKAASSPNFDDLSWANDLGPL